MKRKGAHSSPNQPPVRKLSPAQNSRRDTGEDTAAAAHLRPRAMRSAARRRASQPTTTPPTPTPIRDSRSGLRRICWLGARNLRATGLTRLRRRTPQAAAAGTARPAAPPPTSPRGSAGRIESRAAPPRPPPAQPPQPWIHRKTRKCVVGGGLLTYLVAEVEADDCAERPVERVFDPHAARAAWFAQQMQPALACVVCGTICDQQPVRPRRGIDRSSKGTLLAGAEPGAEPGAETGGRVGGRDGCSRLETDQCPSLHHRSCSDPRKIRRGWVCRARRPAPVGRRASRASRGNARRASRARSPASAGTSPPADGRQTVSRRPQKKQRRTDLPALADGRGYGCWDPCRAASSTPTH